MRRSQRRSERFAAGAVVGAALHEGQVHLRTLVAQQSEVLRRALRVAQLDMNVVTRQQRRVALAKLGIGALFGAGGHYHAPGRGGVECPVGEQQQNQRDRDEGAGRDDQVAH